MAPIVADTNLRPRGTDATSRLVPSNVSMDQKTSFGELIPCGGGDPIPLLKPKLLVGRRDNCDITLRFPNVSSLHCQLELINGYWNVRDLDSRNGIKVNGVSCGTKWLLPGDEVSIANHRFEVTYHPDADSLPPKDEDPVAVGLLEKSGRGRRKTRRRSKPKLPPSVRPLEELPADDSSDSDDDVLAWLSNDGDG